MGGMNRAVIIPEDVDDLIFPQDNDPLASDR